MRRLFALVLMVSMFACDQSDRADTIDPPEENIETLSSQQLENVLLRIEDLPTGWTSALPESSPSSGTVDSDSARGFCNQSLLEESEIPASAEAEFSKGGELSNQLYQVVASYGNRRGAARVFDVIEEKARNCTQWDMNDESSTGRFTLQSLSFPKLGDDTLAVRMAAEMQSKPDSSDDFSFELTASFAADLIVARQDNLITLIGHLGIGIFGPTNVDSAETELIARKAVERLSQL